LKATPARAASKAGVSVSVVQRALEMHRETEHKRTPAPSLT
jgi:hypothetical protein